jgi:hypothetical protein
MALRIPGACRDVLVYLADPLFSEAERRFNLELTHRLEAIGFEVFLPQRDGVERDRPPYDTMTPEERRHAIFHLDRSRILDADVFVLDGLHTDTRAAYIGGRLNPMVRVPLDCVVEDEETLVRLLAEQGSGIETVT